MKYYKVWDRDGGNFMEWTHETPQTLQQLHAYLYAISNDDKYDDDRWTWNNFRRSFKGGELCAFWNIELEEV